MEWLNAGLNIMTGGLTGYITNDLAVKMLFRQYGPFGGVIVKSRRDFTEKVSALVEREIINGKTLRPELENEAFDTSVENLLDDILKKQLYQNTGPILFDQMPGIDKMAAKLIELSEKNSGEWLLKVFNIFLQRVNLSEIFSQDQQQMMVKSLTNLLVATLQENKLIDKIIWQIYQENRKVKLQDWIPQEIWLELVVALQKNADQFHLLLKEKYASQIDLFFHHFYNQLDGRQIIKSFEEKVKEHQMIDFIGQEKADELLDQIIYILYQQIKSTEGHILLTEIAEIIFDIVRQTNLSLMDLVEPNLQQGLEVLLKENLPQVMAKVIIWISQNKFAIETLINQSVDDVLQTESGDIFNLRGKTKKKLKEWLSNNIAEEYSIINYLIEFIENKKDDNIADSSEELTEKMIQYLKAHSIQDIFSYLENKKILTPFILADFIENNMDIILPRVKTGLLNNFLDKKIGDIFKADFTLSLEKFLLEYLWPYFQENFLYTEKSTKLIQKNIAIWISLLQKSAIEEIVDEKMVGHQVQSWSLKIENEILSLIQDKNQSLSNVLGRDLLEKTMTEFLKDHYSGPLEQKLADFASVNLAAQIEKTRHLPVKVIYDKVNQAHQEIDSMKNLMITLVKENLDEMLQGTVSKMVSRNLSKLPDTEIQKIVEGFMGTELKPISGLGALLGGLSGCALYWGKNFWQLPSNSLSSLAINAGVYGFVGYMTNVLALKMIFRPYKRINFMGMNLPFTPGVVAKQKPRFAQGMAAFVDQSLLNPDMANQMLVQKRKAFQRMFSHGIAKENYFLAEEFFKENSEFLSSRSVLWLQQMLMNNQAIFIKQAVQETSDFSLNNFDFNILEEKIDREVKRAWQSFSQEAIFQLDKHLSGNRSLKSFIPEELIQRLLIQISQQVKFFLQSPEQMATFKLSCEKKISQQLAKPINQIITKEQTEAIKSTFSRMLREYLKSETTKKQIQQFLLAGINRIFPPEKPLEELLGGLMLKSINQNINLILKKATLNLVEILQEQEDDIKQEVINLYHSQIDPMTGMLGSLLDIETTLQMIVKDLLRVKIPQFMEIKQNELNEQLSAFIFQRVSKVKISELHLTPNSQVIMKFAEKILANESITSLLSNGLGVLLEHLMATSLTDKLWGDVLPVLKQDLEETSLLLVKNFNQQQDILLNQGQILLAVLLNELLLAVPIKQLTAQMERDKLELVLKKGFYLVDGSPGVNKVMNNFVAKGLNNLKSKKLGSLIDVPLLTRDMEQIFKNLLQDKKIKKDLEIFLQLTLSQEVGRLNQLLPKETKDYISQVLISSLLDSLEVNFLPIMKSLEIKKVTETQVNKMHPEEIEQMFNSFAARYFRTLEAYGWVGAIFGIAGDKLLNILK